MRSRFAIIMAVGLAVLTATAVAELPIIGKARAYLGSEEALDRVITLHFSGKVTTASSKEPKKQLQQSIDIVLQRPDRERITVAWDSRVDITGLNGYAAWHRAASTTNISDWRQDYLAVPTIKGLRAQVLESVGFYRGCVKAGGTVEDEGTVVKEGVTCTKVAFSYAPNIVFHRYFETKTGRLVVTETAYAVLKEVGEMFVQGVRFPKSVVQVTSMPDGSTQTVVTMFDKVTINDLIPAAYFDPPPVTSH